EQRGRAGPRRRGWCLSRGSGREANLARSRNSRGVQSRRAGANPHQRPAELRRPCGKDSSPQNAVSVHYKQCIEEKPWSRTLAARARVQQRDYCLDYRFYK
ncbi:hypothetical protein H1C71_003463, partial [Ictidomys tridecemlineatus]